MHTEAEAPVREPLVVQDVTRRYGGLTALERIDLRLRRDQLTAVVGPSGSGKSTLLELVAAPGGGDDGSRVPAEPLQELATWLEPYRWFWESRFDALGDHLDRMENPS